MQTVNHVPEILNIFVLLDKFFAFRERNFIVNELPVLTVNSILARWISVYLIYGDRRGLFVLCIRFPEIYFMEPCSASTELLRKELGGH